MNEQGLPKVSIVMSVLNGEDYLEPSLQSILTQTYTNFEFIIVDDGSTDRTPEILQKYRSLDERIKLIQLSENIGTSKALNAALKTIEGEFIVRQDADDISSPDRLEKQITFLLDHPKIGLLGCKVMLIDRFGEEIKTAYTIEENDQIQSTLLDYMCLCGPSIVIRRSHFEMAGFYFTEDMSYSEDYDLCLRIGEVSQLHNLNEVLYYYRQHSGSVSHSQRLRQLKNKTIALERAVYRRSGSNVPPELLYKIARDYFRTAVLCFCNGAIEEAKDHLNHSISLYPSIINDKALIEKVIEINKPVNSNEAGLDYVETIFSSLIPNTVITRKIKRKMISRIHMNHVFKGIQTNDNQLIKNHIWKGIKDDPGWLLNRGILKTLVMQLIQINSSRN